MLGIGIVSAFAGISAGTQETNFVRLGSVSSFKALSNGVEVRLGGAAIRVEAIREDLLRVRISPDGVWPEDASWAVLPTSRIARVPVEPRADGFRTQKLVVRIERTPMRLVVEDLAGHVVTEDAPGFPVDFHGVRDPQGQAFHVSKTMRKDEHFFGLGDKTGSLDRRMQSFVNWNSDSFGYQESTDPIYKSIPFFLGESEGRYYGIYLDNTWRSSFDFGKSERDVYSFGAEGGPLDYYILSGPKPKDVVEAYGWLTGTPPLPPLWSFGYQQSRYSYAPEAAVRDVAARLRADKIPADVLWLDIDYQDRHRPFTVDPVAFPNMPKLIADMRADHFHMVAITDLHVALVPHAGYAPYDSGKAIDAFVKAPDGKDYIGRSWPGDSSFPDFTQEKARTWWGTNYKQFVSWGFAGFWNDMNEPSIASEPNHTMPLDIVHRIAGDGFAARQTTHREVHNIYGMENARGTFEGVSILKPDERPYVMTRATFAGGQRFGVTWTGDNSSTWNHLKLSTTMIENLGLSGFAFAGADVGGFVGSPSPELMTKWVEIAAFQPIDRDHTSKQSLPQELWAHGDAQETIRRHYIETRYRLMPYIYTTAEETSRTGIPMVRPLFLEFPDSAPDGHPVDLDRDALGEFMWGPDLLVAPEPYLEKVNVYSPKLPGEGWYDFWNGRRLTPARRRNTGGVDETATAVAAQIDLSVVHPQLDVLPVYVRAGAIVPMQQVVQSTDEIPAGPLELHVYPGKNCAGSIYLDDGHSFAYRRGAFFRERVTCSEDGGGLTISFAQRDGSYAPWWKQVEVVVHEWPGGPFRASLDTADISTSTHYDQAAHALHILLPETGQARTLRLGRP